MRLDLGVRAGNDVDRHQLADPPGRRRAGIGGRLHGADVAAHHDRDVAGADVFLADQDDVRRLHHGIGGLDRSDEPFCLDQPQRFL